MVLQFDTAANLTAVKLKPGTPAAAPEPPAILQNHNQYELGLCTVSCARQAPRSVTAADITDTRADEDVCGLMRDSVTGIPTEPSCRRSALAMMTQLSSRAAHQTAMQLDAAHRRRWRAAASTPKSRGRRKNSARLTACLPATADQLGGVKVGEALDIAPDGTLSAKTLNDKIAAAVAVKSEPRLVWNHYEETGKRWKTYDIKMPDGLDYVHVKTKYNSSTGGYGEEVDIAKGGTANHSYGNGTGIFASNTTFQTNGTLHFATETSTGGYTVEIWLTGYHYPTLAELVAETQAAQADTDALAVDQEYRVAMLELGLTDDTTTDTSTT